MINIEVVDNETHLVINNKRIKKDNDDAFLVEYDDIISEDLSELPAGTRINIKHDPAEFVKIRSIRIIDKERVQVFADDSTLVYDVASELEDKRIQLYASGCLISNNELLEGYKYERLNQKSSDYSFDEVSFETSNGTVEDIVKESYEAIISLLQPLLDALDDIKDRLSELL